jgi:hypothetical protein
VTLVRIFSCFNDRDHVHPHIHANSYTGSYAKHAIHPPKINTPKYERFLFLLSCKRREGSLKRKKYMLKKHRKKMWSNQRAQEKKERKRKHDSPPK